MIKMLPRIIQLTPTLHWQYHGCQCLGEARNQGISSYDHYSVMVGLSSGIYINREKQDSGMISNEEISGLPNIFLKYETVCRHVIEHVSFVAIAGTTILVLYTVETLYNTINFY